MKIRLSERNMILKTGVSVLFAVCAKSIKYLQPSQRDTGTLVLVLGFVIILALLFYKDALDAREERLASRDRNNELNRMRRLM